MVVGLCLGVRDAEHLVLDLMRAGLNLIGLLAHKRAALHVMVR